MSKAKGGTLWPIHGWVLTRVDGENTWRVRIKQEDIDGACCRDPNNCVVARAFERYFAARGTPCKATVSSTLVTLIFLKQEGDIWVPKDMTAQRYVLTRDTKALIRHFDQQETYPVGVAAEIVPVPPHMRLGVRNKDRGTKKGGRHQRKKPAQRLPTRGWVEPQLADRPTDDDNQEES